MRRLLALFWLLAAGIGAVPAAEIVLVPGLEQAPLSGQLSLLRDPTGSLAIADVARLESAGRFQALAGNLALGYTTDTIWLGLAVTRRHDAEAHWLLEIQPGYLDDVQLYTERGSGFDVAVAGDRVPLSQRHDHSAALFELALPPGTTRLFIRVKASSTMAVIPRLWSPQAFESKQHRALLLHGTYFGLMLAVVLFNVISGIITRRRICFLYSLYALSATLVWWSIGGFLGQIWLPEAPAAVNLFQPASMVANILLAIAFYHVVLDIGRFPLIHRYYQGFGLLVLLTLVSAAFGHYQSLAPWMYAGVLGWIPLTLLTIVRTWAGSRLDVRFAGIAYACFSVLAAINILTVLGLIDASMWTLLWAGQASNLAHILLLHVSIMLGLRQSDAEKRAADIAAAEARRQARREREAAEEKNRFLSMITHEIRTPISVIAAASDSLRILDTDTSPQRIDRYDKIGRAVQRMAQLVDLLLTRETSRIDQLQTSALALAPVDLVSLSEEIIAQYPDERQRLTLEAPAVLPLAQADSRHLRFALINLIDNAIKYSTPGTAIEIRLAPHEEEGFPAEVEWRISNRGARIPASQRERIFDKHARLDETAEKPGLGLGLYLARHIVHQHEGRLFVDPHFTAGTCFIMWLPAAPAAQ